MLESRITLGFKEIQAR